MFPSNQIGSMHVTAWMLILLAVSCSTYVDIRNPEKGSPVNPVLVNMPEGEHAYLGRLSLADGSQINYEYDEPVIGMDGHILDRFLIELPERRCQEDLWGLFIDLFRTYPHCPDRLGIYLDMYHPESEELFPPSGFTLNEP